MRNDLAKERVIALKNSQLQKDTLLKLSEIVKDKILTQQEAMLGSAKALKFITDITNAKMEVSIMGNVTINSREFPNVMGNVTLNSREFLNIIINLTINSRNLEVFLEKQKIVKTVNKYFVTCTYILIYMEIKMSQVVKSVHVLGKQYSTKPPT